MAKVTGKLQITLPKARAERLQYFDAATRRHRARQARRTASPARARGWTREQLYARGRVR